MQGCDDISTWMFYHSLSGGALSLNIQNSIICVWSFIITFTYISNYCLNNRPLPSSNFDMWMSLQ
jgi:hypothetical protein